MPSEMGSIFWQTPCWRCHAAPWGGTAFARHAAEAAASGQRSPSLAPGQQQGRRHSGTQLLCFPNRETWPRAAGRLSLAHRPARVAHPAVSPQVSFPLLWQLWDKVGSLWLRSSNWKAKWQSLLLQTPRSLPDIPGRLASARRITIF